MLDHTYKEIAMNFDTYKKIALDLEISSVWILGCTQMGSYVHEEWNQLFRAKNLNYLKREK